MTRGRANAMVERVSLETGHAMGGAAAAAVAGAVRSALDARDAAVADDHDPRLLHPARTVLILLSDHGCRDAAVLAAAAFAESLDLTLRADPALLAAAAGDAALQLYGGVPLPADPAVLAGGAAEGGDDELLERLVSAEPAAAVIALAEMLDHARHLHLRPGLDWRAVHALVVAAYIPAAIRLSPGVGRRLQRWAEAFGVRRLAGAGRGGSPPG